MNNIPWYRIGNVIATLAFAMLHLYIASFVWAFAAEDPFHTFDGLFVTATLGLACLISFVIVIGVALEWSSTTIGILLLQLVATWIVGYFGWRMILSANAQRFL